MTTARCIQRTIDNLRATIAHHEHQYRILLEPEITDTQFDALKVQLAGLLATHPQYALSAPLPAVGSDRTEGRPIVAHRHPMLSLDATSDLAKVLATFAPYLKAPTLGVSIEPKLDGLALSLRYVDGQLVAAAIRGDGTVGEDVIGNATVIATIPQRLTSDAEGEIEVRGEVVVYRAVFNAYNEQAIDTGKRTYTNPRSMAAAAMRLQDPAMAQKLGAHFIAYEAYGITQAHPANPYERVPVNTRLIHDQLTQWGFDVVPAAYVHVPSNIEAEITRIEHVREQYPYDIDGAVIKLIDPLLRELLGSTSAHPRWAMAYKYPAQEAFTTITAVVFQTGRTGAITPVVKVEPTPLGGTTVRSVTLHNPATLTRMALRIGDTAVIRRANDVIPYFVKALPRGQGPLVPAPTCCDSCQTALVAYGASGLRCMNSLACPAQAVTALIHFAGKTALDIEGMGKERLTALWKAQAIATPADLYRLTDLQLENVLGLHPQFAGKLLMGIGASKFTTLPRLLVGLGVEGIGQAMSKALAVAFHYDAMAIFHAKAEDFMKVPGWDKTRSRAMERYCAVNYEALMDLLNQGLSWPVHRPMPTEAVLPLDGKTVVVTGRFDGLSRDALITYLQTHGATVASRVGKSTYTVLVGQKPTVTKLTTANALAIPTLSLADFIAQHHLPGVFHD